MFTKTTHKSYILLSSIIDSTKYNQRFMHIIIGILQHGARKSLRLIVLLICRFSRSRRYAVPTMSFIQNNHLKITCTMYFLNVSLWDQEYKRLLENCRNREKISMSLVELLLLSHWISISQLKFVVYRYQSKIDIFQIVGY